MCLCVCLLASFVCLKCVIDCVCLRACVVDVCVSGCERVLVRVLVRLAGSNVLCGCVYCVCACVGAYIVVRTALCLSLLCVCMRVRVSAC